MAAPLLLLLLPFLLSSLPAVKPDLASDSAALLAFRAAVGRSALQWNATTPACFWPGVECGSGRVIGIHLPGVGLIGQIPAGLLGNLTALRTLSLRFNALSGPLPSDLASLSELRNLYLQGNRFSGEIPAFLFSLPNLVRLNLAQNNFSGEISPSFNKLTRLGTLYLESNRLSGQIPAIDLPNLVQFNVSFNQLNGPIPVKLRTKPADAFLGMSLCGGLLGLCPGEIAPAPAASGENGAGAGAGAGAGGGGGKSGLSGGAIAGIAVGSVLGFLILVALLVFLCRRRGGGKTAEVAAAKPAEAELALRDKRMEEANGNGGAAAAPRPPAAVAAVAAAGSGGSGGGAKKLLFFGRGPGSFDLEDLLRASAEVLGKGTFGTAYKAVLEMGAVVAVKRLRDVSLPEKEFREKIETIGAMDHPNLVPLRAYYYSKDEKLLVYDYMPMGSLSALLHG